MTGDQINERVARLPKWRGIPVPFFVTWREDGVPDFKVVSESNRMKCATERLCWICGEKLLAWVVFIGGPASAKSRLYVDGPMHDECARDAVKLCPFLAGRTDYAKEISLEKHAPTTEIRHTRTENVVAPEEVVLYKTRQFAVERVPDGWLFRVGVARSITHIPRRPE